jgi:hypothetical protein
MIDYDAEVGGCPSHQLLMELAPAGLIGASVLPVAGLVDHAR